MAFFVLRQWFGVRKGVAIKKIKTSQKGRKCKFLHCKQILSIYNHEAYCHIHLSQCTCEHKLKVAKAA